MLITFRMQRTISASSFSPVAVDSKIFSLPNRVISVGRWLERRPYSCSLVYWINGFWTSSLCKFLSAWIWDEDAQLWTWNELSKSVGRGPGLIATSTKTEVSWRIMTRDSQYYRAMLGSFPYWCSSPGRAVHWNWSPARYNTAKPDVSNPTNSL